MTEERITEVHEPSGTTHTHTTVVSDTPSRGGGTTVLIVLVLVVLGAVGLWLLSGMSGSEVAKDNAVAEAASEVGDAAGQVGDAAQDAAGAAKDAADNAAN